MGQPVKFGHVAGGEINISYPVAASTIFKHKSGCFVVLDSNNRVAVAGPTDTNILGWAYTGQVTSSSTAGQDKVVVNINREAIYEIPSDAAVTEATLLATVGETTDIIVTSDIQYANLDASAVDVFEVVDYRYYGSAAGQQSVFVRLYLKNLTTRAGVV